MAKHRSLVFFCIFFATVARVGCAADVPKTEMSNSEALVPTIDQLRESRESLRDQSLLATHAYERENTVRYMRMLNDQLVSVEALAALINQFKQLNSHLGIYNSLLDACARKNSIAARARDYICNFELERLRHSVDEYYELVDSVGSLRTSEKFAFVGKAMDPLLSRLAEQIDTASSMEARLDGR